MSLSKSEIQKVARLARIKISSEEALHFSKELSQIIDWVDVLKEVNTDNVEEMVSVTEMMLPLRKDEVSESDQQESILKNAPKTDYGCFSVPKVVES